MKPGFLFSGTHCIVELSRNKEEEEYRVVISEHDVKKALDSR